MLFLDVFNHVNFKYTLKKVFQIPKKSNFLQHPLLPTNALQ